MCFQTEVDFLAQKQLPRLETFVRGNDISRTNFISTLYLLNSLFYSRSAKEQHNHGLTTGVPVRGTNTKSQSNQRKPEKFRKVNTLFSSLPKCLELKVAIYVPYNFNKI